MVQNLKKVLKSKISKKNSFLRHEVPFKAKNNREAVVVCAIHVVKRPSKRSVLVSIMLGFVYSPPFIEAILYGDNYSLKIKVPHSPLPR